LISRSHGKGTISNIFRVFCQKWRAVPVGERENMFDNLRADLAMAGNANVGWSWTGLSSRLKPYYSMGVLAVVSYRCARWVRTLRVPVLKQLLMIPSGLFLGLSHIVTGVHISSEAEIGPGLVIHTPHGIFVPKCKIGYNCALNTGVLIGARTPSIGNNVYFGPGSKLLGAAKVGNNVVVAANAMVITDVPDNTTIMGNPARIKLRGGRPQYFAGAKYMTERKPKSEPSKVAGKEEPPKTKLARPEPSDERETPALAGLNRPPEGARPGVSPLSLKKPA
jgi:serine O-acetyltransferase